MPNITYNRENFIYLILNPLSNTILQINFFIKIPIILFYLENKIQKFFMKNIHNSAKNIVKQIK